MYIDVIEPSCGSRRFAPRGHHSDLRYFPELHATRSSLHVIVAGNAAGTLLRLQECNLGSALLTRCGQSPQLSYLIEFAYAGSWDAASSLNYKKSSRPICVKASMHAPIKQSNRRTYIRTYTVQRLLPDYKRLRVWGDFLSNLWKIPKYLYQSSDFFDSQTSAV
jgi:hypothetical protein